MGIIVAGHNTFPSNITVLFFHNLLAIYFNLFWRCVNVELNSYFGKAGMRLLIEGYYYFNMGKVIVQK